MIGRKDEQIDRLMAENEKLKALKDGREQGLVHKIEQVVANS